MSKWSTYRYLLVVTLYLIIQYVYCVTSYSIPVKFDFLLDEKITINDPRVKSIIYAALPKRQILITYTNSNAKKLAFRIAEILTHANLPVLEPVQTNNDNPRYVLVYVRY